jgi:6-phosphogluconolactonase
VTNYAHEVPNENPGQHIVSFAVGEDGLIGEHVSEFSHHGSGLDKTRQGVPHAHCCVPSRDDRFLLVSDLGTDSMLTYRLNAEAGRLDGVVMSTKMPPGSGPRHFVFHPNGRSVYVANELSATVSRLAFDEETGMLSVIETVPGLPGHAPALTPPADIHIAPDGRFLYVSFRGIDCIATYALDAHNGAIQFRSVRATEGRTPRSFTLSRDGAYLIVANQDSDSIVTFKRDSVTGEPGEQVDSLSIGTPMCVKIA